MKPALLLLGVTTFALAGASTYLWNAARGERERNDGLQARVSELEAQLQNQPRFMPEPPPPPMAQVPPNAPPAPMAPLAARPAPRPTGTTFESSSGALLPGAGMMFSSGDRERMAQDPEYRALRLAQSKEMLKRQYSDLGRALNLPASEVDKIITVLAERNLQMTAGGPLMSPGGDPADMFRKMEEIQRQKEADVKALLGDAKYQEWVDYKNTMGTRMQVRNLRAALEGSSEPLREDQYQSLVTAMTAEQRDLALEPRNDIFLSHENRSMSQAEQVAQMEQGLERTAQYNLLMRDAAAPYLSSTQLERFDQMLKQQLDMQRMNLKVMQSRMDTGMQTQTFTSDGATFSISRSTSDDGVIGQTVVSQGIAVAPPPPPP